MRRARPRKRPSTLATKAPKKTVRAMVRKKSAESPSRPKAQYTPAPGRRGAWKAWATPPGWVRKR